MNTVNFGQAFRGYLKSKNLFNLTPDEIEEKRQEYYIYYINRIKHKEFLEKQKEQCKRHNFIYG